MGTPREYGLEENGRAIEIITDNLKNREIGVDGRTFHLTDDEFAKSIITDLDEQGLVTVKRHEWERVSALAWAIRALSNVAGEEEAKAVWIALDKRFG